jgi:hypothetical protein
MKSIFFLSLIIFVGCSNQIERIPAIGISSNELHTQLKRMGAARDSIHIPNDPKPYQFISAEGINFLGYKASFDGIVDENDKLFMVSVVLSNRTVSDLEYIVKQLGNIFHKQAPELGIIDNAYVKDYIWWVKQNYSISISAQYRKLSDSIVISYYTNDLFLK